MVDAKKRVLMDAKKNVLVVDVKYVKVDVK